jgi:hypothetical protein
MKDVSSRSGGFDRLVKKVLIFLIQLLVVQPIVDCRVLLARVSVDHAPARECSLHERVFLAAYWCTGPGIRSLLDRFKLRNATSSDHIACVAQTQFSAGFSISISSASLGAS